ncbi:CPBP family intramembrane glutamic endopeptidase [Enemella evansiae]|uniref:CPBP family intramembrane glutamic endopeptidase n=1 Tax=Enemella evansiae TaxID=2016499 RepID=UPI000B9677CA|nr:type II CAAX endopeptidase family protein [Enemella evansiae]OYO04110.1 CPBP family intramembrane metalloprotease [Enemella evansiae]OYO13211.1 CPBP family intramembrane metalloprotease [Enemella evansiae]
MSKTLSIPGPTTTPTALARTPLLVVLGVLLLRTALLFASNLALAPIVGGYQRALLWANVAIVPIDGICLVLVRALLHRQGRTIRGVLSARLRDSGWAALCSLILIVAFVAGNYAANLIAYQGPPPMGTVPQVPLWLGIWAITIMPITIALAEQLLYRGFALDTLAGRLGAVGSLLVVSFFFALQHAALTPLDGRAQLARFITTFVAGIAMGLLYRWRKRLWPVVVAHWFLDVVGLGLPLLLAALR